MPPPASIRWPYSTVISFTLASAGIQRAAASWKAGVFCVQNNSSRALAASAEQARRRPPREQAPRTNAGRMAAHSPAWVSNPARVLMPMSR